MREIQDYEWEINCGMSCPAPYGKPGKVHDAFGLAFKIEGGAILRVGDRYEYWVDNKVVAQRMGASKRLLELFILHKVTWGDYDLQYKIRKIMENECF